MAANDDSKKTNTAGRADSRQTATTASAATPQAGVRQEVTDAHQARIAVPGADQVDARLDNRTGADRPPVEQWPAKPQQIDGPDVAHQVEHTRRTLREREQGTGVRKGMFSPGPHGLSDESLREGGPKGTEQTLYGTESLTKAEVADGTPKADA
ncbi:hypothetical protein [Micromonospora aurantiaca (nom. illeg.)]|uniref:hypothetical protein n=1 Tax=Micromonospora aurantiaca (nom. illeg.) TaxID=47850 RepID=UPI003403B2F1